MAEINLLPNDLRDKEEKEREAAHRKSHAANVPMSAPASDRPSQSLASGRPSLMSRLFSKRIDQPSKSIQPGSTADVSIPTSEAFRSRRVETQPDTSPAVSLAPKPPEKTPVPAVAPAPEKHEPALSTSSAVKKTEPHKRWHLFNGKKDKPVSSVDTAQRTAGGLDVNLIPVELARQPELDVRRRLIASGLLVFGSLVIVVGIFLGMTWYQVRITHEIKQLENSIMTLDADIDRIEKDKQAALDVQQRLTLIRELIDHHTYWTKFFGLLEQNTIRDVYYTNFAMAGTGSITIAAVAKDYRTVAEQLVAFEQADNFVSNVRIDSASAEIDGESGLARGVTFNINLDFVEGIFNKPLP